ncbi:hypothetical protein GF420_06460 [candidate division GN15 bacterium]|nr:hypothetical protein [candidate division GN15 bacterium]
MLNDSTLSDYSDTNPPPRITSTAVTPESALRFQYETMRADANSKLDDARKMIIVSIINHLLSGFEAYISTKKHNDNLKRQEFGDVESPIKIRTSLKSYHSRFDTPFVNVAVRF